MGERVIWKNTLKWTDRQTIEIPEGASFLSAHKQYRDPCIWYSCDPQAPKVACLITMVGTGHPVPDDAGLFIGTVLLVNGDLVLHVFCAVGVLP